MNDPVVIADDDASAQKMRLNSLVRGTSRAVLNWMAGGNPVDPERVALWEECVRKWRTAKGQTLSLEQLDWWNHKINTCIDILADDGIRTTMPVSTSGAMVGAESSWLHIYTPAEMDKEMTATDEYIFALNRFVETVTKQDVSTVGKAVNAARADWRRLVDEWVAYKKSDPSNWTTSKWEQAKDFRARAQKYADQFASAGQTQSTIPGEPPPPRVPDSPDPPKGKPLAWYWYAGAAVGILGALGYLLRSIAGILPARTTPAPPAQIAEEAP